MTDQGKNNTRIVLAALAIVSLIVTAVIVPIVKSGSNAEILQRLARLEECTRKIETVPERVAALAEATSGLKVSVDRLEKKMDEHITKGR